jgi:hypothetical protein
MPDKRAERSARHAGRHVMDAYQGALGKRPDTNPAYVARGPAKAILKRYNPIHGCEHVNLLLAPGLTRVRPNLELVIWCAWNPEYLMCSPCATMAERHSELSIHGTEENYRCDYCRDLCDNISVCSSIIAANKPDLPPVVCQYGLCARCVKASGMPRTEGISE